MEEEDDDFYDPADSVPTAQGQSAYQNDNPHAENVDEEVEEEEEEEDDVCCSEHVTMNALADHLYRMNLTLSLKRPRMPLLRKRK